MSLTHFEEGVKRTGFALEHQISEVLRASSWRVISNKYYIDDSEETVREIDLIAYRAREVGEFSVYTVLIISCKKNEANAWVLYSRAAEHDDPNRNFYPVHAWTNEKILAHQMRSTGFPNVYYRGRKKLNALKETEFDVFAFQEMKRETGAPQNDKAIFQSVTSLMKAQAYEKLALPARKKDRCIYQFSLLTVVDAQMVRVDFGKEGPKAVETQDITFLANYIVNKTEEVSRIRLVGSEAFAVVLKDYESLHEHNCAFFKRTFEQFYTDIFRDPARVAVLLEDFKTAVRVRLEFAAYRHFKKFPDFKGLDITWFESGSRVQITLPLTGAQIELLNEDKECNRLIEKALADVYHYFGEFELADEIPF